MKIKHLYILSIPLFLLILFSCKKKETQNVSTVSTETLNAAAAGGTVVSTQMQTFMLSAISVAADSGHSFYFPNGDSSKLKSGSAINDNWIGPDANGWYTFSYTSGIYTYYERLHMGDTIEYIMEISYSGSEGSYDSKTTTEYIKQTVNGKTTYNGSSIWNVQNSGYSEISNWEWRIYFTNWDPSSSAGTYDWYWGLYANNGGNTVPYHRFAHMVATETTPTGWLQCLVIFYDNGGNEVWRFEYVTPWVPVTMPQIPGWG